MGYLLKDRVADVGQFLEAVTRVGNGGTVLDADVVSHVGRIFTKLDLAPDQETNRRVLAVPAYLST